MTESSQQTKPTISTSSVGRRTIAKSFELTPRRIQAFAAGINDFNPLYFDDARPDGLIGHPGLVFSFQWNSRFQPDIDVPLEIARLGVHAWTDVRFHRPFRQGDVITSQGETVSARQIRPGVESNQRYTMTDATGAIVAELDYAGITRGAVTDGPDRIAAEPPPLPDPPTLSDPLWVADIPIAPEAAHVYTECAEIYNPIHTERSVALAAGLPDIILHGSATTCIAMREIIDRCLDGDPTRLARFTGQLRAMVLLDTQIQVRCLADVAGPDGSRAIYYEVRNGDGDPVLANGVAMTHSA